MALLAAACLVDVQPSYGLGFPPVNLVPPAISGSAVPGQQLVCSTGTWLNSPTTYAYSWRRDVVTPIGSGSDYMLTSADVGHLITCQVTASNSSGGGVPATSLPVTPVSLPVAAVPINTALPSISGSAVPSQTLSCSRGAWINGPTGYAYSWQRDAGAIVGQTSSTYAVTNADVGNAITCTVVAKNGSGSGPPAVSVPVLVSAAGGGPSGGGSGGSGAGGTSGGSGGSGAGGSGSAGGSRGVKVPAPHLKLLAVSPSRVVVTLRRRHQTTKGALVRYAIDRAAAVLIYVQQKRHGRYVTLSTIAVKHAGAGTHRVAYDLRSGKKILAAGRYRLIAAAANSGGWSSARTALFTVVRKKMKRIG